MSQWIWIKQNWKWLLLLWFNGTLTIASVFASWLSNWGIGLILYLSAFFSVGILMAWKEAPDGSNQVDAVIQITDQAIYEDGTGYCCCKYCGSENQNLAGEYKFDPRLHYPSCIVARARLEVDPRALVLAPGEAFNYQGARHEEEV